MEARQSIDQGLHADNLALLIAHPDEVARQLGGSPAALEAIGAVVKADCLCWPLSVVPPEHAARLYAVVGRALFGTGQETPWLARQVRQ